MIIATAGHIDHGKTMLVQSLTGVETDQLPEEKSRGMTIDLGFAYSKTESKNVLGFIDVPGHEKFIKNMIAGVSNIDFVLLVVAADDGPMPQTKEHLEILNLLDVTMGAAVITKVDKVSQKRIKEVKLSIRSLLYRSSLSKIPIFSVSNMDKVGIAALRSHLNDTSRNINSRKVDGNFRLAVDRSFTLKGVGCIVTGSVHSGKVTVGDELTLFPSEKIVRVRAIHSQNTNSETGKLGERCALSLVGSRDVLRGIKRGDWVLNKKAVNSSYRIDAILRVSSSELKGLKHWISAHLHFGAGDITCRVAVLEGRQIDPGQKGFVQIVLDEPISAVFGDRFILRDISAKRVLAGGKFINIFAKAKGRTQEHRIETLRVMVNEKPSVSLKNLLRISSCGVDLVSFCKLRNLTLHEELNLFRTVEMKKIEVGKLCWGFSLKNWRAIVDKLTSEVRLLQEHDSIDSGVSAKKVRSLVIPNVPASVFEILLNEAFSEGKLSLIGGDIYHASFPPKLTISDQKIWKKIEDIFLQNEFTPPTVKEISRLISVELKLVNSLFRRLCDLGLIVKVTENKFYLSKSISQLAITIEEIALDHRASIIDLGVFRNKTGLGRNGAVEILEFFDRVGITARCHGGRIVKRSVSSVELGSLNSK